MKELSKLINSCLLAIIMLLSASVAPVSANPWVYDLYEANELPDGVSYGTVSLSYIYDGGKRGVRIAVTANQSILSPCSNFGIQRFGFNTLLAVNKYGDGCECEGNFDRDQDVDGTDAFIFKENFGRFAARNPCTDDLPCYGDFEEDADVDGTDAIKFKDDFGRGPRNNVCPSIWADLRMILPPEWSGTFGSYQYSEFGRFQIDTRGDGSSRVNPLVIDIYHLTENLSYTDFVVSNDASQFFSAHIADFSYKEITKYMISCSECMSGYFASPGGGPLTTTTTCMKTTSTTTIKPSSTTTCKPTSTTTIKPPTTTTSKPVTTSTTVLPITTSTSTVPTTTTSVPTTTSSQPVITTTMPSTTTSQPTTTSTQVTTTSVTPFCTGEIYKGGICELGLPIDDPAYNRPGRRGLAITCEDVVDFCICTDCVNLGPECLIWTIDPSDPYLSISKTSTCSARLKVGESCDQLEDIREYTVRVTDTCNGWTDSVVVELGRVTIDVTDIFIPKGIDALTVPVKLVNRYNSVRALATDICACNGGDDKMVCTGCTVDPARALDFSCAVAERDDGCCSVILYATNPSALIVRGTGPVLNVIYEATEQFDGCSCLMPVNRQVSDRFNEALCACQSPGEVCFRSCGDIYPQDCLDPGCAPCGDNVVDLYDVLEAIDIILGISTPTDCQIDHGDVPNGLPPYCGDPAGTPDCDSNGDIDIFDALVIIDMAQGRSNCCDYCLFRRIF